MCFGIFSWHSRALWIGNPKDWMFVGIVGLISPCSAQTSQVVQRWKGQRWVSKKPVAGFRKMGTDGPPKQIKQGHGRFTLPWSCFKPSSFGAQSFRAVVSLVMDQLEVIRSSVPIWMRKSAKDDRLWSQWLAVADTWSTMLVCNIFPYPIHMFNKINIPTK